MKKIYIYCACTISIIAQNAVAQNIGIGTTSPQSKLHVVDGASGYSGGYFPGFTFEGNGNRYLNYIVPASSETGLLFGNNSSASQGGIIYNNGGTLSGLQFRTNGNATRMVIDANGNVGIGQTSPGFPLNFANSLGDKIALWGNAGAHYGLGIQNALFQIHTDNAASDIAFGFGTSGSFTENMRIKGNGVLQFPPSLAKKIILYPGSAGDAGLGVFGNELRIASDYSGADITFGYDNRSTGFTEKFRMKANGALVVNGDAGQAGQVLTSAAGGASTWSNVKPSFYSYKQSDYQLVITATGSSPGEPAGYYVIGGLHNQTIVLNQASNVVMQVRIPLENDGNTFGSTGTCALYLGLYDASNNYIEFDLSYCFVFDGGIVQAVGFNVKSLPAGTYRTHVKIRKFGGDDVNTGWYYTGLDRAMFTIQINPQ